MMIFLASLTSCTTIVGDFCDVYTVIDMPDFEAKKLERQYQDRILANEKYEFKNCP